MTDRKSAILQIIIDEHLKTGQPVASAVVAEKFGAEISPATVRNDMAELEAEGQIYQPHTSAGRVPTAVAYAWYIENLSEKKLSKTEAAALSTALGERQEADFKQTAKALAELSGVAVFWAFHRHNLYYTGISNLLAQPEFQEIQSIQHISLVIDQLDEIIDNNFSEIDFAPQIFSGNTCPFGNFTGAVMVKYKLGENVGLFGLLGPLRMDYRTNLALIKFVHEQLS